MKTARETAREVFVNEPIELPDGWEAWEDLTAFAEDIFDQVEAGGFPILNEMLGASEAWENKSAAAVMLQALEAYRQELFIGADAIDTIIFELANRLKIERPPKAPMTERGKVLAIADEEAGNHPTFAERLAQ